MGISIVVIGAIMESRYTISRDLKLYRQAAAFTTRRLWNSVPIWLFLHDTKPYIGRMLIVVSRFKPNYSYL